MIPAASSTFDLIETLRFEPDVGVVALDRHLDRLRASSLELGFALDPHAVVNALQAVCFRANTEARVRLRLSRAGAIAVEVTALPANPAEARIAIVPLPVASADWRLRHKTSDRGFYDRARAAAGTFEVIFVAPDGLLTEGSFTTLFVPRADGVLRTPPRARGLLPGVLRALLLAEGRAIEETLRPEDLRAPFFIGNALRGLISARLA